MLLVSPTVLSNTGVKLNEREYYELLIKNESIRQGVDTDLARAVVQVESRFNPRAMGPTGDVGLFQLSFRFGGKKLRYNAIYNVKTGISELKYWKLHCPTKKQETYLICYNAGYRHPKHPELNTYYKKVMAAKKLLASND